MSEEIKKLRCPDCGDPYNPGAKTCRSCGKTLAFSNTGIAEDPDNFEGMPLSDWHTFIDKNADYYLNVFKKNKGKDYFLKFNWATFFLGFAWFAYRKMYKQAIVLFFISVAFSFVFSFVVMAIQLPMIQKAINEYKPYTVYLSQNGEVTEEFERLDENQKKQVRQAYWDYKDAISDASTTSTLVSNIASIMVSVAVAFLSNWLYHEHILNHTVRKKGYVAASGDGGTSLGAALFIYLFGETIMQLAVSAVSIVILFVFAGI